MLTYPARDVSYQCSVHGARAYELSPTSLLIELSYNAPLQQTSYSTYHLSTSSSADRVSLLTGGSAASHAHSEPRAAAGDFGRARRGDAGRTTLPGPVRGQRVRGWLDLSMVHNDSVRTVRGQRVRGWLDRHWYVYTLLADALVRLDQLCTVRAAVPGCHFVRQYWAHRAKCRMTCSAAT